jgi:DNA-binding transcriptional regulator YdaS (Cro superfamily)
MDTNAPVEALNQAIELAGGQSALAQKLTDRVRERGMPPVSPARISNWVNRDKRAASELCPDIEAITGVKCESLRPDVDWGFLRNAANDEHARAAG